MYYRGFKIVSQQWPDGMIYWIEDANGMRFSATSRNDAKNQIDRFLREQLWDFR